MTYPVKKLFNGFASVRDYIVKKSVDKDEDMVVTFEGKQMTIPLETLKNPFQIHKTKMRSKYKNETYELLDFRWKPDEKSVKINTLL